ncbi:MAG: hypothetical protein GKS04_01355 [Candidatus Mycalebacterium zealandia]|nr:MAG: hypothetical protein GKS04_01355 [Candidatus Mycalebacterium zealandia]
MSTSPASIQEEAILNRACMNLRHIEKKDSRGHLSTADSPSGSFVPSIASEPENTAGVGESEGKNVYTSESVETFDETYKAILQRFATESEIGIIVQALNSLGYSKNAERLLFLHNYDVSEEEDQKPLSLKSAQGFLSFIAGFQYLGEPGLGLFSEGTLSVGWRIADNKHLLVEPLNDGNFSYALIGPSVIPSNKSRHNGRGTKDDVIIALRGLDVHKWRK